MKLTGRHYRAIGVFAKQHDLRLALSAPPHISFIDKQKRIVTRDLSLLLSFYDSYRKETAKERARAKR